MIKKLRIKFICVLMTIVTIMLAAVLIVTINFTGKSIRGQSMEMMRSLSKTQINLAPPGKPDGENRLPFFTVQIGRRGEILTQSGGDFDLSDKEYVLKIIQAALAADTDSGELTAYGLRFLKNSTPSGYAIVFTDLAMERSTLRNMLFSHISIFLGAEIIFLCISILLSHWVIRPVETAWNQQRQFVADASHELKTPLSVIMANAELMQNEDTGEEDRRKYAGNILTVTYQMRTLVENMLETARVDNGTVEMNFTTVDLSQLVSDAVLSFQLLYEEQQKTLVSTVCDSIRLQGSERHLYQVMDVLLDNALKYSAPEAAVRVELAIAGRQCVLSVASPGEPIPREELKKIFKRFYRGDKARTMNGSYGLGLAIAEAVVEAHKGKIWAESGFGVNTFFVQLPVI